MREDEQGGGREGTNGGHDQKKNKEMLQREETSTSDVK